MTDKLKDYLPGVSPGDLDKIDVFVKEQEGESTVPLVKALAKAKLVSSMSEARRLIVQGGVSVDGERIRDGQHVLELGDVYLVQVGSKKVRKAYVTVK